jgi:hypothetical protein
VPGGKDVSSEDDQADSGPIQKNGWPSINHTTLPHRHASRMLLRKGRMSLMRMEQHHHHVICSGTPAQQRRVVLSKDGFHHLFIAGSTLHHNHTTTSRWMVHPMATPSNSTCPHAGRQFGGTVLLEKVEETTTFSTQQPRPREMVYYNSPPPSLPVSRILGAPTHLKQ